jgi:HK97 gp10 family phage protein
MITVKGTYTSYNSADAIVAVVARAAQEGCEAWADLVLVTAQDIVPVRTGELRDSGHLEKRVDSDGMTVDVVFDAPHAMFVEFGTGLRGRGTYPGELPTEGVPITGSWIYDYRNIKWLGMPAKPYMRPAFDENVGSAESIVRQAVMSAIS